MILLLAGCMTMDPFFFAAERVDAYTLPTDVIPAEAQEEVAYPTADGGTLYGVWAHQDDPAAPVLVHFHGNTGNLQTYFERLEFYYARGYEAFVFDYRGFGRSEGTPSFTTLVEDGAATAAYVAEATGLPLDALVYDGVSLGGGVAVHTAATHPPKVLITEDMFASADRIIDDGSGLDLPPGWFVEGEWDNAAAATRVHVPYLVQHGALDDYVRPSHAEAVYAAANEPKRLWLVPGADHDAVLDVAPEDYAAMLACWIAQSCPAE